MSLRPEPISEIPPETVRVARAAFPKGTVVMRLQDEFSDLYRDEDFSRFFQLSRQTWRPRLGRIGQPTPPARWRARRLHGGNGAVGGGWRERAGCDGCGDGERRGARHTLDRTDRRPRNP